MGFGVCFASNFVVEGLDARVSLALALKAQFLAKMLCYGSTGGFIFSLDLLFFSHALEREE